MVTLLFSMLLIWYFLVIGNSRYLVSNFYQVINSALINYSNTSIRYGLMLSVIMLNLVGIWANGHNLLKSIEVTLLVGLSVSIGSLLINIYNSRSKLVNMIMPDNISLSLIWIIVMIEILGYVGRSITMSIRLTGNLSGGDVLGKVIGKVGVSGVTDINIVNILLGYLAIVLQIGMELMVCIVQGYVIALIAGRVISDNEVHKDDRS